MMGELLSLLFATGAGSFVTIALVLLARGGLRRWFGPGLAYGAWMVVPVVILALSLSTGGPAASAPGIALAQMVPAAPDTTQLIVGIWLAGALATALALAFVQARYVRALGALRPRDGLWYTSGPGRAVGSTLVLAATVLLALTAWQVHPAQAYSARAAVIRAGAVCPLTRQSARMSRKSPAPTTTTPITRATR